MNPPEATPERASGMSSPDPASATYEFARKVGRRRLAAGAPVRKSFVSTSFNPLLPVPPLAALLRGGGRGGQLRLKLYLSLLWVCASEPFETSMPARAWAALLGLPDPDDRGVRRIHEATRDLRTKGLIQVRERGGHPNALVLLDESGSGEPYRSPASLYNQLRNAQVTSRERLRPHQYFKIPSSIWTAGYIQRLGGPGMAMLLVLLCERVANNDVWFSPGVAHQRFALASSTRSMGLQQLRQEGLISTRSEVISEDGNYISFQRRRNVHRLTIPEPPPHTPDPDPWLVARSQSSDAPSPF